jgi:hypothetical protein
MASALSYAICSQSGMQPSVSKTRLKCAQRVKILHGFLAYANRFEENCSIQIVQILLRVIAYDNGT